MLGRFRRTTGLDVGLALCFSGVAYLIWSLVAGTARGMVQNMILAASSPSVDIALSRFTMGVRVFFVDAGFVIDLVGLIWLLASLVLVLYSARQKLSVSWAWASAISQGLVAALGGVLVGYATNLPYRQLIAPGHTAPDPTALERVSEISLPLVLTLSVVIWVTFLVWLLVARARFKRRGPSLSDGLRTNLFR